MAGSHSPGYWDIERPQDPRAAAPETVDEVPDTIGIYEVDRVIARGAHGVVFKATDPDGLKVAVKWLAKRRDEQELDTIVRLSKTVRGMPPILNRGVRDDRTYFVMPYYERRSLRFRLRSLRFPQPVSEVMRVASAFTDILGELHRHGYTHFDVKPDNLLIEALPSATEQAAGALLRSDERLVLTDFGTTRAANDDDHFGDGTLGYAAPELLTRLIDHDPRVDVYAASASLVECMTGTPPAQVRTPTDAAFDPEVFRRTGPLEPVLRRGLSHDPDRRPATLTLWLDALRHHAETVESLAPRRRPPRPDNALVGGAGAPSALRAADQLGPRGRPPAEATSLRRPRRRPTADEVSDRANASARSDRSVVGGAIRNVVGAVAAVAVVVVGYALLTPDGDRPSFAERSSEDTGDQTGARTDSGTATDTTPTEQPSNETPPAAPSASFDPVSGEGGAWISRTLMADDRIEVTWSTVEGAGFYHLHRIRSVSDAVPDLGMMTSENQFLVADDSGVYVDTKVETGARYWYGVRALDANGALVSYFWHLAVAVTDEEPPAPVGAASATVEGGGVRVSWTQPSENYELHGYRLLRAVDGGAPEILRETWDLDETSFVDADPPPGGVATYTIVAFDLHWNESMAEVDITLP